MRLAFQILMIFIIVITFIGSVGESDNKELRQNMIALCIASIAGFVVVTWLL